MLCSNDITGFKEFGYQTSSGVYSYSQNNNLNILIGIRNSKSILINNITPSHREVHYIDLFNYIIEKSTILQDTYKDTYFTLLGRQGEDWVKIVPDVDYPEAVIEFTGSEKTIHYVRIDNHSIVSKNGVIVVFGSKPISDFHDPNLILRISKMNQIERKGEGVRLRHIPFGIRYYFSEKDMDMIEVDKNMDIKGLIIFESFSPEERKRKRFAEIRDELIERTHTPERYFDWCLDIEEKDRISKYFKI